MKLVYLFTLVFLPCLAGGCSRSQSALPVISMQIGKKSFQIEVAATPESQETGLMKRDSMPSNHGMIFTFPQEKVCQFWMKNTRFPLDIIFLNTGGAVVSIHQMVPYDENLTSSDFPSRYAIELNEGAAATAGVKVGDVVAIPDQAKSK